MMPRPVFLLTEQMDHPHGTEMFTALLLTGLRQLGHPVHLFTTRYDPSRSAWSKLLAAAGVTVKTPGFWFCTKNHLPHRVCAGRLRRLARRVRPALVMALDNEPFCCRALEGWDVPETPFFVHDPNSASSSFPHYHPLWFRNCQRITALSVHGCRQAASARDYYKLERPIQVWPSSFAPKNGPAVAGRRLPIRFGLFGRMHSQKGGVFAVAAFHQVCRSGANAELHFFGTGPMQPTIAELTNTLGLDKVVKFHGPYHPDSMDHLMSQVDVGLMPSIYEGFGIVMLELMSRGRPVIASDVGSSQEVLGGLGGGIVVERADTASLAAAMIRYCREPGLIAEHGAQARKVWEQHFTVDAMTERFLTFWRTNGAVLHKPSNAY